MINENRLVFSGGVDVGSIKKHFPNTSNDILHNFVTLSGSDFRKKIDDFDLDFLLMLFRRSLLWKIRLRLSLALLVSFQSLLR